MESASGKYVAPEQGVRAILSDVALSHEPASPTVRQQINAVSKFHPNRKGRIRVNKEVLGILKQVSAELDAAQRHYLAHKQYGDAAASILSISPELVSLPGDPSAVLAASASEAALAGAGCDASGDAAGGERHAGEPDTLLAHGQRRWGYFSMLSHLRAESAKAKKVPPQQPKTVVIAKALPDIAAAAAFSDDDSDDSPKANWMQLMKQKKQAKECTFARMIRVRHAVLVVQRAWRAHVKKRASKALAMMMLRAKVRRAHRAAYVSNLLRRKTGQTGDGFAPNGEPNGEEQLPDEDVQLTAEEETEMAEALQTALNEGTLSMADIEELQLTELVQKMKANHVSNIICESAEGEEPEQAPTWKSLATVTTPLRRGLTIRLDGDSPSSGSNWMGSLRTPGSSNPGGTHVRHSQNWELDEGSSKNSSPRSRFSGGGKQRLSSSKSVSIRGSGSDVGSPRNPSWGPMVGPDGVLASPRNRSATRGRSGGIRVGKGVSVVLATADNAVAVAHGDGGVHIRANSAARQAHLRAVSRFKASAAASSAAADDADPAAGQTHRSEASTPPRTPGSRLSTPAYGSRLGSREGRAGSPPPAAGPGSEGGVPHSDGTLDPADAAGQLHRSGSNHDGEAPERVRPVPITTDGGRPLSRLEFQTMLGSSPIPDDVADSIKAAASKAAIAAVAAAAGEAATAGGLEPGTAEWHEKQKQLQTEYQQQFETEYQQQYRDHRYKEYQHQYELYQQAQQQECVNCVADPVNIANDAAVTARGRSTSSPVLNEGPTLNNGQRTSTRSSREGFAGARSTNDHQQGAAMPHYARPLASRSSEAGRRSSAADGRRSSAADGGNTSTLDGLSHPGTSSAAASRRTTREGPRGFCATSAPGGAFSRYERGLGDGLQQEYRVLAAEAVLAAGRGPSPGPPKPRKSDQGGRSSCDDDTTRSDEMLHQHDSLEADISMTGILPAVRRSLNKRVHHVSSDGALDQLQQQMHTMKRAASSELLQSHQWLSYSSPGAASSGSCILAGNSNDYDPAEAAAAIAAAVELHQEKSAAAAAAASGVVPAAMRGLVLGPDGTWQPQQQQSRADAWFERLKAQRKAGRQPWDTTGAPARSNLLEGSSRHGSSESMGLSISNQGSERLPSGKCGTRASVHNAWLYIGGRAAAALPWQALAAATATRGGYLPPGGDCAANPTAALAAAEAFMSAGGALGGSHFKQLSVEGKRLLVKLMWLKSAAGVLRGLGRDPQALESTMWQLLKKQTGPEGAELLLWSVADQKQQRDLAQQQQLLWQALQASNGAGPAAACLDNSIGALGGWSRQQHTLGSTDPSYPAAGNSAGLPSAGINADLLGQYLPLLPAARSKALASRPQQQGPYQQQQHTMLAHLQLLQWQNQQPLQGADWPHALLGQQLSQQQVAILQHLQLQGQQQLHSGNSAAGPGQTPMAHRMQLAERIGHGSPSPEAAAGRPLGQHDVAPGGHISGSSSCESDDAQRNAAYGKLLYDAQQLGRGWGDRGNSALALYGSRSVLLQAPGAVHAQQKATGLIGNQWQSMQQQQLQQRKLQQETACTDTVLAPPSATVQKRLGAAELGWQPQIRQQPRTPASKLTQDGSTQQTGKLHPYRTLPEPPSVPLVVYATEAGEQANAATGPSRAQHRMAQQIPSVSYSSALTNAATDVGAAGAATEAEQPVYVSFVASNRYQQQLKAKRRTTVGSLMPSRSTELIVQRQQPQQQPEGIGAQSMVVHQLGGGWAPRGVQGFPAISFPPTGTAGGSKHAGVHNARTSSPGEHTSISRSSSPVPMQGIHHKQQQPTQKRLLKASLVGGLPVVATGSLDGFRLQPGSLQAFMDQQQLQQQQEQPLQQYSKPPSIDMLVSQQRQQQQHEYLGSEQEWARPRLRSAVGSLAGASGVVSAGEQQQQPGHRQCPEPDAPQLALGVRTAAARQRALRITTDGVQWQGQRQVLGASQNGGSNVTLSVARPELPQLAALRVSTEGRSAAQ